MKQTRTQNTLVGSQVLIDWPIRWRGCDPQYSATAKAEAEKKEFHFGETGEIVAYNAGTENAKDLLIRLDKTGELINLYQGAVTITKPPGRTLDTLLEIRDTLIGIKELIRAYNLRASGVAGGPTTVHVRK